jgi:hypothetical protein
MKKRLILREKSAVRQGWLENHQIFPQMAETIPNPYQIWRKNL